MEQRNNEKFNVIKVATSSDVNRIAGAIVAMFKEKGHADIRAVGAGAVNQAMKALIIAKSMMSMSNIETAIIPSFENIKNTRKIHDSEPEEVTAIRFRVIKISFTEGEV